VRHQEGNVVSRIADPVIDQEPRALAGQMSAYCVEQLFRRTDVSADRTDIGLDHTNRDSHDCLLSDCGLCLQFKLRRRAVPVVTKVSVPCADR